ncbi:MAG TPA: biliverdin-producing heme oxygenase [Methylophilus sp.]|uniref:biliverdin-producing heme oxygenase n=1 Tax=Methylophilus sp. TaxID=29541 RepID=UPI002BA7C5AA|nr:biliverdin-producing heme oxygenase [Methylophilus sp.]HSH87169.1 biliverdin-producing heme oxygenase [Methylophilus sp.]
MIITASDTVLPLLRKATAELHAKLDNSLPLASSHPLIEDYSQHLLAFKLWLSEIAAFIDRTSFPSTEFSQINAMLLKLLDRDLQTLKVKVSPHAAGNPTPARLSVAYCLGIEYVVKGSALGTAMLHHKATQLFPAAPIEFMQDSKMHGKYRWKKFLDKLEAHAWTEEDLASAQEGSVWAFQRYIQLHEVSQLK